MSHRLVGPDWVEEGGVVPAADLRQDEGQVAVVPIQLRIHEELKVKQVSNDVHGCRRGEGGELIFKGVFS